MTEEQLKQVYYLSKDLQYYKGKLRDLREMTLTGSRPSGMPKSRQGDKVSSIAAKIADTEQKVYELQVQLLDAEIEIMKYISGIDDSLIRSIIFCRHIRCMPWTRVAREVGGTQTAATCRKALSRYMLKSDEINSNQTNIE